MKMTKEELQTLLELTHKAYKEDGIITVSLHADAIHVRHADFCKNFQTLTTMKRCDSDGGAFYKKIAKVDGITYYCYVDEADMTAQDKEDAEWFGVLKK